jgi:uncharacterized lipoprotein YmbA
MIGVGPVEIAAYIDRPQIVTRIGENELNVAEFNRWASPIRGEVTRVLAENLAVLLSTDSVLTYPWRQSADVKFQVMVDIEHFDGKSGDGVFLQAQWGVFGADGEVLLVRKSTYTEQVNSKDYSSYVDALSLSLDGLSRDIAAAIEDLSKQASYK